MNSKHTQDDDEDYSGKVLHAVVRCIGAGALLLYCLWSALGLMLRGEWIPALFTLAMGLYAVKRLLF